MPPPRSPEGATFPIDAHGTMSPLRGSRKEGIRPRRSPGLAPRALRSRPFRGSLRDFLVYPRGFDGGTGRALGSAEQRRLGLGPAPGEGREQVGQLRGVGDLLEAEDRALDVVE